MKNKYDPHKASLRVAMWIIIMCLALGALAKLIAFGVAHGWLPH